MFLEHTNEVISGGQDGMVLLWSPNVHESHILMAATTGTREKDNEWNDDNEECTGNSEAIVGQQQQFVPPILR